MTGKSCCGCTYLYTQDTGYSNWTVEDTEALCAKDKNPNLPLSRPYDWNGSEDQDNWPATQTSRCGEYRDGVGVHLDVDADVSLLTECQDADQLQAMVDALGDGWSRDKRCAEGVHMLSSGEWVAVVDGKVTAFAEKVAARTFYMIETGVIGSDNEA